jgi:hypothetical protein
MSTPKTGNDFEHLDIAGTEQVKESYRAALQEEPRAIIDDAIRAAARRAVSSAPTSIGKRWAARWTTPLAAAATVMLTSSVIFMAVRDRPEVAPPIAEMVAARDAEKAAPETLAKAVAPAAPAFERDVVEKPTERVAEKNADIVAYKVAEKRRDAVASVSAPAPTIIAQPLQQYQPREKKTPAPEPVAPVAAARMQDSSPRAMSAPPAPTMPLEKSLPAPTKPATAMAEVAKAPAKVLNEAKKEAVASGLSRQDNLRRKQTDSEATANLIAKTTGVLAPPPLEVIAASPSIQTPPRTIIEPPAAPRSDAAAAPSVATAAAPAPTPDAMDKLPTFSQRTSTIASEKSGKIESVDAWIKRMTELKRQEKNKELADEVVRFRKRYPTVELPKELIEAQN